MKHDTFERYRDSKLDIPQRALLTAWNCLESYHDDLVLVGGLAIKHLTRPPAMGLPGPVTLDVDFGIWIGASAGMSAGIREKLAEHDFIWKQNRFYRNFEDLDLYIDLLTDSLGPMRCAAFRMNNRHREPELEDDSMQIRQQCVTLAKELLA